MNYLVIIQGGLGPDVWDRELSVGAVDFLDAAKQAVAKAEEFGGQVVSVEVLPWVERLMGEDKS